MPSSDFNEFDALVFDVDGVLIDSERVLLKNWHDVFVEHGCSFTREEWLLAVGSDRGFEPYEELVRRAAKAPPERIVLDSVLRDRSCEEIREVGPLPGVLDWIDEAERIGLKLAIASGSSAGWVDGRLGDVGLLERIAVRSCRSSELRAKPSPDLYLDACWQLGVAPARAIAVEDSVHGVHAAVAAGLCCIAVPNEVTAPSDFSAADLVLGSLTVLSLAEALERLKTSRVRSVVGP